MNRNLVEQTARRLAVVIASAAIVAGGCAAPSRAVPEHGVLARSTHPAVAVPPGSVTIAAVGDAMLGDTPVLTARPAHYLDHVRGALLAPITFGNLEGTLTTATRSKCGSGSPNCFAFRVPPRYAGYLRDAGFDVLNSANNHSHDFGATGLAQTSAALRAHGIRQSGLRGQIALVTRGPTSAAFVGFAPYTSVSNLLRLRTAAALIRTADSKADLVVVYMHAGAEGADKQHVTGREEFFLGEDRGNPERFAHMAVRNGADLVIASGPHVLRGMEIFHHHLIAYSLDDFCSYHNFNTGGVLGLSAVLRVTIGPHGWFRTGRIVSVKLNGPGRPGYDASRASARLIGKLSRQDFGARAVRVLADGRIVQR